MWTLAGGLYCRRRQYITVKHLDPLDAATAADRSDGITACLVVASPDALRSMASEIPSTFRDSVAELERRVTEGCVVSLARRPRPGGRGMEVVGYELAERGVFSALGRRRTVGSEIVFSHWCEVLPAYRGQRIHRQLFAARDAYFREKGVALVCGVCAPRNRASLRALQRDGAVVVGVVTRSAWLGGALVWETPWQRIEPLLRVGHGRQHALTTPTGRRRLQDRPDAMGIIGAGGDGKCKSV
jgi:GNAT superfamily N-acetyltransferase